MYLDIPVFVEIVDTSDAASVTVWVINMTDVPCSVTWVTGNHGLKNKTKNHQLCNITSSVQSIVMDYLDSRGRKVFVMRPTLLL